MEFSKGKFRENGDFILEPYQFEFKKKKQEILFSRNGHIRRADSIIKVEVVKSIKFDKKSESFEVEYKLRSPDTINQHFLFGIENNFNFQAGHAEDRYIKVDGQKHSDSYLDSYGDYNEVEEVAMIDEYRKLAVAIKSDRPCRIWHLPIFTVSLSEAGFEKVYQGTTLVNLYNLELSTRPIEISLNVFAGSLKNLQD
jgi:alpha-amylase